FLIFDYLAKNAVELESATLRLAEARLYDMRTFTGVPASAELLHPPFKPYEGTACRGVFAGPHMR
ncbi:MAG: hypothetical protein ACREMQ_00755, partial [Longimicrobiales bacterium]